MLRFLQSIKKYRDGHQPLYHISLVVFLWALADGIISFALPIFLKQSFQSLTIVGIIFASSSFFGLIADILLGSEQKGRTFKSYFILSSLLAVSAYLLALKSRSVLSFVIVMALWGFYYDIFNFGLIDFLNKFSSKWEHAQSSGVVQMFFCLGYLIAPITAGYMVLENRSAMIAASFFMILSLLMFLGWFRKKIKGDSLARKLNFIEEIKIWKAVVDRSWWVLLSLFLLNLWDSLIWSLGPIFLMNSFGVKGSFIMACFMFPRVFLQGFAGNWADKKGKKKFLVYGLISAGLFLTLFGFQSGIFLKTIFALFSAVGASFVYPAADGLFIDMIDGYSQEEEEITGIRGFGYNLAYIIGPLTAGFLAEGFGMGITFSIYGLVLMIGTGILGTVISNNW